MKKFGILASLLFGLLLIQQSLASPVFQPSPRTWGEQVAAVAAQDAAARQAIDKTLTKVSLWMLPVASTPGKSPFGANSFVSDNGEGDSITYGTAASPLADAWFPLLSTAIGASGNSINNGIPGTVVQDTNGYQGVPYTSNMRDRFTADMTGINKRSLGIMAGGFNDARQTCCASTLNSPNYGIQLRQVLDGMAEGGYDINHTLLVCPYYINDAGLANAPLGSGTQTRAAFVAYVTECLNAGFEYGVFAYDAYTYGLNNGYPACIGGDNIHPLNCGHVIIETGALASQQTNTLAQAAITASGTLTGELDAFLSPPSTGPPLTYTSEYALAGTYSYTGTTTGSSTTPLWTSLASGTYCVRTKANYSAGPSSPWNRACGVNVSPPVYDTFTDTPGVNITAHTGEAGSPWIAQPGLSPATPAKIDNANRLYSTVTASGTNEDTYQASGGSFSTTSYYCKITLTKLSTVTADGAGCATRMDPVLNQFYFVEWNETSGGYQMRQRINGVTSQIQGTQVQPFNPGESHVLELITTGTATVEGIMIVDGVTLLDRNFNNAIPAAGKCGVYFKTATTTTTGIHASPEVCSP